MHSQLCYPLTGRGLASAVFKGIIGVRFLAVVCFLSQSRAQPLPQPFFFHWFLWVQHPAPFAPSIRLQWTITALWGVDTFSCSSICGVVINFLSVIGLSYNILRLEAACSAAINHETKTEPPILWYHLELFTAAMIQRDRTQWPISIKKTWGSFVCHRLLQCLCSIKCAITLATYATYKDNWFAWSISIDPTKVSSMKLILFIVYKQPRRSLEEDAVQALTVCIPAQTCGERVGVSTSLMTTASQPIVLFISN